MELTHERPTLLDSKANNKRRLVDAGRVDAGRSAVFRPATDEWHSVGDGQWSGSVVSIWTHWQPVRAACERRCTGRSHVAACRELSLAFGFRVAIQRCAWLR